jgi:hypothetical protein
MSFKRIMTRKRRKGGKVPGFKSGGRADRKPRGRLHAQAGAGVQTVPGVTFDIDPRFGTKSDPYAGGHPMEWWMSRPDVGPYPSGRLLGPGSELNPPSYGRTPGELLPPPQYGPEKGATGIPPDASRPEGGTPQDRSFYGARPLPNMPRGYGKQGFGPPKLPEEFRPPPGTQVGPPFATAGPLPDEPPPMPEAPPEPPPGVPPPPPPPERRGGRTRRRR